MSEGVSLNELAKFVLVEYAKQSAEGYAWPMPQERKRTSNLVRLQDYAHDKFVVVTPVIVEECVF
jgi:hypothetical protein